ncbi:hypothetical protein As57867_003285, partial [Aphanomyces stellatus]
MKATTKYQSIQKAPVESHHPLDDASFLSKAFFTWASPLLTLGNTRQLHPEDLWPLQLENQCHVVGRAFEPAFHASGSIFWASAMSFRWTWAGITLMQVGAVLCGLYAPVVLRCIVSSMESNAFDLTQSLLLIASLVAVRFISSLLTTHSNLHTKLIVVKVTSALQHLLFQKTLRLDAAARRTTSTGQVANMFVSDIHTMVRFSYMANKLWILPLQITLTLVLLYDVIGWATFVGAGVIIVTLWANQIVSNGIGHWFRMLMQARDARMKAVHEVFASIQIIKLNAWEDHFATKVTAVRAVELNAVWHIFAYMTASVALLYMGPTLITLASFAAHTMLQHEILLPSKLFTALNLFTLLKQPFTSVGNVISATKQATISARRLVAYLDLSEKNGARVWTPTTIDPVQLKSYADGQVAIAMQHAAIGWDKPLFEDVNLTIKQGEFVVVHGAVGQGKSSLCAALLGEIDTLHGSIFVGGRVAYYSQQAWIQNLTIRENILFGKPYDRVKYNRVLEACALTTDLTLFAAGDRTEIGQKGVTLSGGQKARVGLARACYSDADIFILDAPLSAVDAIVQNEIFTKCFLGLLRHKTIVLVTHSPEIIESKLIDRAIEVKHGQVVETRVHNQDRDEPLVEPLAAHAGYDSNPSDAMRGASMPDYQHLVSPTASTPLPVDYKGPFTPAGDCTASFQDLAPSGQLVPDEVRTDGKVAASVYFSYLAAAGGWSALASLVLALAIWQVLSVSSDLWLNVWSATAADESSTAFIDQSGYYLGIYAALSMGGALTTALRSLVVFSSALNASKTLFAKMTQALLHAPLRFFDQNPVGRILGRYTADIWALDTDIPIVVDTLSSTTFLVACSLATAVYMTKYLGLLILPLLYIYVALGQFYVQPAREMERVGKTTKSPLLNLISESIEGALVIRAFGASQMRRFQRMHFGNVDAANAAMYAKEIATQWLVLRIQLTSVAVLAVLSVALLVMRARLSPGLVGLSLNYAFSSLSFLETLVPMYANFETLMVAPERIAEYCK